MARVKPGSKPIKKNVRQIPAPSNTGGRAVAKHEKDAGALVRTGPTVEEMLAADAGSGMETMGRDSFAIPRLSILQALSPQVIKSEPEFIPEAAVGMIFDSVSGSLYDGEDGIDVVLVSYRHSYINWWPRNSKKGKGFIADLGNDPACLKATRRVEIGNLIIPHQLPNESEIVPTHEYFALLIDDESGALSQVLIPMAKTNYGEAKKLNTKTQLLVPVNGRKVVAPLFYRVYRMKTKTASNEKGTWFVWDAEPGAALLKNEINLPVRDGGDQLYLEARAFKESINKGEVKVQKPGEQEAGGSGGEGAPRTPVGADAPM